MYFVVATRLFLCVVEYADVGDICKTRINIILIVDVVIYTSKKVFSIKLVFFE